MPSFLIKGCTFLAAFLALGSYRQSHANFIDNFNSENGGVGVFNYTGFANWVVTAGSVDLIGNGYADIYPGNGLYVDLNGTTNVSGTLASKAFFGPGTYDFSFSIGNNPGNGIPNMMTVSLGTYSETFTETGAVPLETISREITLTTSSQLVFATPSNDSDDFGVIIDNVSLISVSSVPEPGSLALMGVGGLSWLAISRIRRRSTARPPDRS